MDFQTFQRHVINDKDDVFSFPQLYQLLSLCNSKTGDSLLHVACRYGKYEILRILVEQHKGDVEISNYEGKRLLHEAAQYSQTSCVKYLVQTCNVQVDPLKRADWTPLMLAATKNCIDVIQTLLEAGANPLLKNKDGWNVFHIACREGHLPILELLLKNSPSVWETQSNNLRTPLHTTALHGKVEAIFWLLDSCHYDVDACDSCGATPFMDALRAGYIDVASILVKKSKANPYMQDKIGRQAIHQVSQSGQLAALDFLINTIGVSPNVFSEQTGETPLHIAAKEGQHKVIERLLEYGGDIDMTDHKGRTALHIATGGQYIECVKVLLKHGAKVTADNSGNFPADLARKQTIQDLFTSLA